MADISSITIQNGDVYDLKDTVARSYHHLTPIATKTYTDVIATTDDNVGAGFFYLKYRGTAYNSYWHIITRVIAEVPGYPDYHTDTVFDIHGYKNTYSWYACLNRIKSTSYRPIYYNSHFRVSETGYNNGCGGWIGFNLISSTNNLNTSYKRTIEVQVLWAENCTVELQDSLVTSTNIPNRAAHTNWYSSTDTSFDNFDACNYGLKQTGDANTTNITNVYRGNGSLIADSALYRYQLIFQKDENTFTPLNNNKNTTSDTKTMLTDVEFDPFGFIYYYATTTDIAAGGSIGAGALYWAFNGIDLRYTLNCNQTMTAHKPIYLVVNPQSNGMCKLDATTQWTNALPNTADGKWYILLGRTYSTYQIVLYHTHPVYYHDGTTIRMVSGKIPASPSTTVPMRDDLTGSTGSADEYARADHVHPISTDLAIGVELQYKLSTSDEDPYDGDTLPQDPTDEDLDEFWSTIAPALETTSQYLWQRTVTTYIDASIVRGSPSCISTITERVEVSTNIANLSNEYYLSTSSAEPTGGAWSSSVPSLSPGHYIWTRIKLETTDGASSYTDPMLHDALNSIATILDENNTAIENQISDLSDDISDVGGSVTEINDWITTGAITKPDGTSTQGVKITKSDGSTPYSAIFTSGATEIYDGTDKLLAVNNKKVNASSTRANSVELASSPFGGDASEWKIGTSTSGFTIKWIGG